MLLSHPDASILSDMGLGSDVHTSSWAFLGHASLVQSRGSPQREMARWGRGKQCRLPCSWAPGGLPSNDSMARSQGYCLVGPGVLRQSAQLVVLRTLLSDTQGSL